MGRAPRLCSIMLLLFLLLGAKDSLSSLRWMLRPGRFVAHSLSLPFVRGPLSLLSALLIGESFSPAQGEIRRESGAIWSSTLDRGQDSRRALTPFGFSRTNRCFVGAYTSCPSLSWSSGTEIPTPPVLLSVSVQTALGVSAYCLSHAGPDYLRTSVYTPFHLLTWPT